MLGLEEFFYDLLVAKRILPLEMLQKMQAPCDSRPFSCLRPEFEPLNVGWAKGQIQYGTGLMIQQSSWNASYPPVRDSWGSYVGHGGDTYGFLSESGFLSQFNASFSATANEAWLYAIIESCGM